MSARVSASALRGAAIDAVVAASKVCREVQSRLVAGVSLQKGDKSPVTVADFAAQAIVSHLLAEVAPAIPMVGEEDASALREPDNAELAGKVVASVQAVSVDDPSAGTGCIFAAVKGEAAVQRGVDDPTEHPVQVNPVAVPAEARFCESVEKGHTSQSDSAKVAERLGITAPPYRIDSQCKYAAVARGDAAVYLRLPTKPGYVEKTWDHAAGVAVIEAAGGTVTDCRGEPLDFSIGRTLEKNKGVIVTNGRFHDQVVTAVRAQMGL
jgi:3'-phosphoadenosine 5'-phosphosulfate (PAPS) 3'-phosphatase